MLQEYEDRIAHQVPPLLLLASSSRNAGAQHQPASAACRKQNFWISRLRLSTCSGCLSWPRLPLPRWSTALAGGKRGEGSVHISASLRGAAGPIVSWAPAAASAVPVG